jgi:hypothetical protein
MAKLNQILLGLALLLCAAPLAAQPCYIQLGDATGLPLPPAQLAELEAAACELRAAFPAEFQGDFAVYDFGFYLHQEGFAGGVPAVFQAKVAEVESESAYFLLFGRQLSRGGGVSEVWVEVRLPSESSMSCLDEAKIGLMKVSIQIEANLASTVFSPQLRGIRKCKSTLEQILSGDCCPFSSIDIEGFLQNQGFLKVEIPYDEIIFEDGDMPSTLMGQPNQRTNQASTILDYAGLDNDGYARLEFELTALQGLGGTAKGYITSNQNICTGDFESARQLYDGEDSAVSVWWHFYEEEETGTTFLFKKITPYSDYLYFKYPLKNDIFDLSEDEPCKTSKRMGSCGNLIFTGTVEHWYIELDYVTNLNPAAFAEYSIPYAGASGIRPGYVDIAVIETGELFEIKPESRLFDGRFQIERYVNLANIHCPTTPSSGVWVKGTSYPFTLLVPRILPHPMPAKIIMSYLGEPGVILYRTLEGDNVPSPVPVAIPASTLRRIKKFLAEHSQRLREIDIEHAIRDFLEKNPDVEYWIKAAAVGAAMAIVVATIIEDIVTLGAGIADDWASFYLAYRLVRFAF